MRTRSALRAFTEDDISPAAAGRAGYPLWSARQTVSDERQTGAAAEPVRIPTRAMDLTLDQAAQRVLARMEAQRTSLPETVQQPLSVHLRR
ncbi:hypothetical protein LNQ03_00860 [Klebsiella pneumoniae subsp. pneumoniae]|nr:hypothetical protein [Klebsiella pneumoniae subsp. pneumoniae]